MELDIGISIGQLFPWVLYSTLGLLLVCESVFPRTALKYSRMNRWVGHAGLYCLNIVMTRLFPFLLSVSAAHFALSNSIGILHLMDMQPGLMLLISILLYDCWHYWRHRLFHFIPLLWLVHRLHHSDPDLDVTTEFKHHPFEILAGMILDATIIVILGISPFTLLVHVFAHSVVSMLSHANIEIPPVLEKPMRWILITPDMHRIHHSAFQPETDSNYGAVLSCWDRLFKSYTDQPADGHANIRLGLDEFRGEQNLLLHKMLIQPFYNEDSK